MTKTLPRSLRVSLLCEQVAQSPAVGIKRYSRSRMGETMKLVTLNSFAVVGIEARTSNAAEMSFEGVIPDLWGRFMQEGLAEKIADRADENILALYTDYESDDTGMYTIVLGAKVNAVGEVPEGMVVKQVPASSYAVVESPRGPLARVVFEAWEQIWKDKALNRSYQADFEVYGPAAANPRDGQIEIYVGVTAHP